MNVFYCFSTCHFGWLFICLCVCVCTSMYVCVLMCVYTCFCLVCVCLCVCVPAEFFDLISKAQSNRADDQRGLLNKSDLQLPDFLRLSPVATNQAAPPPYDPEPSCSTPYSRNPNNGSFPSSGRRGNKANSNDRGGGVGTHLLNASHQSQSLDSALGTESGGGRKSKPPPPFPGTISPIHPSQGAQRCLLQDSVRGESVQMLEEDTLSDLTLVGEGDINSPSLNYVTPSALQCKPHPRPQQQAQDGRPSSGTSPVWTLKTFELSPLPSPDLWAGPETQ